MNDVAGTSWHPPGASGGTRGERARLLNVAECNRSIHRCLRTHRITGYLPFHAMYNLGEYPSRNRWTPGLEDERNLDELARAGVQLIQVHEEWNDSQRLFGGDKFSPVNPEGFTRFVAMVHERRMKIIAYVSSGYFDRRDPDFRPEWARGPDLTEMYYHYAPCSPASPGWRAYLMPRLVRAMEENRLDGLYDDCGYRSLHDPGARESTDEIAAFEETPDHDGAMEDLLGAIHAEVKRRSGILKVHIGGATAPRTRFRVYDYLWVGEGGSDVDGMREIAKHHRPYVTPCLDMSRATIDSEDDLYLHSIPYLQFPVLLAGRPVTGERASVPGIRYQPERDDFWMQHFAAIRHHYLAHPEGPHSYGWWDSTPGRPGARSTWCTWMKHYAPLVGEGTWAYLEIHDSDFFGQPLPDDVVASAFANQHLHLVLANYAQRESAIRTRERYLNAADPGALPTDRWRLPPRTLLILCRIPVQTEESR